LKPCIIGIILATGIYMILQHSVGRIGALSFNTPAVLLTVGLTVIYFGSRKGMKNGISPIGLISISALAGILIYGL
jgi:chromate transporter